MAMLKAPGFTAEASLYRAREQYHAVPVRPVGSGVLPAQFDRWRQAEDCACVRWICNVNPTGCVCVRWICNLE
jgi:hypothetical protein